MIGLQNPPVKIYFACRNIFLCVVSSRIAHKYGMNVETIKSGLTFFNRSMLRKEDNKKEPAGKDPADGYELKTFPRRC